MINRGTHLWERRGQHLGEGVRQRQRENQRLYSLPRGDRGTRWIVRKNVIKLQIAITLKPEEDSLVSRLRPTTTNKTLMIRMGSLLT